MSPHVHWILKFRFKLSKYILWIIYSTSIRVDSNLSPQFSFFDTSHVIALFQFIHPSQFSERLQSIIQAIGKLQMLLWKSKSCHFEPSYPLWGLHKLFPLVWVGQFSSGWKRRIRRLRRCHLTSHILRITTNERTIVRCHMAVRMCECAPSCPGIR